MKDISEYINESIRLDEAKNIKLKDVLDGLDKIDDWNKADNIKKLMAEYLSAGDAEEFDPKHWTTCVAIIDKIAAIISDLHSGSTETIDMGDLTDEVTDGLEENNEWFIDFINKKDKEGDWDVDGCINLFNTVSMKVCKEAWLI
jgi:hypothetical protein